MGRVPGSACRRRRTIFLGYGFQPGHAAAIGATELSSLREGKGLSQDTLARSVGISPAYLALIEAGERVPDAAIRRALARALEIDGWEGDA